MGGLIWKTPPLLSGRCEHSSKHGCGLLADTGKEQDQPEPPRPATSLGCLPAVTWGPSVSAEGHSRHFSQEVHTCSTPDWGSPSPFPTPYSASRIPSGRSCSLGARPRETPADKGKCRWCGRDPCECAFLVGLGRVGLRRFRKEVSCCSDLWIKPL